MRRHLLWLLAVGLGASLLLWGRRGPRPSHVADPATARATVLKYLHALETRDTEGVMRLVPDDDEAAREVEERLQQFGGARESGAQIHMTADLSPDVLSVSIRTATQEGHELAWTENFFWRDGRWWLVLGGRRNGRPVSDTRRPSH